MPLKKIIVANLKAVSELTQQAEHWLHTAGYADPTSIALVIQELCVNIVEHGYAGEAGKIALTLSESPTHLEITIQDWTSRPFAPPDDITLPDPMDLPEGGWGLYLIYQIMDKVVHTPLPDGNRWQLIKHK